MARTSTKLAKIAIPVAGMLAAAHLSAAVPHFMTEQGRLFDANGMPVDTGNLQQTFVFTIYDAATNGTVLWTETQTISISDGYFSAVLGQVTPVLPSVFDGTVRYLGVKVGADPEMTPRQPLSAVPYAMVAENATGDITPTSVTINNVKVIDENGDWTGNPTGLAGPQGNVGPQGATGATGPQGANGAAGPQGANGAAGPQGANGAAGPQGANGVAGGQGPQGATGGQGPQGATGGQGPDGILTSFITSASVGVSTFNTNTPIPTPVANSYTPATAGEIASLHVLTDCQGPWVATGYVCARGGYSTNGGSTYVTVPDGAFNSCSAISTYSGTSYLGISSRDVELPLTQGTPYTFGCQVFAGGSGGPLTCYCSVRALIHH